MERTLDVRTGESIAIRYELAGLGSRFLAVGVDLAIQLALTVAVVLIVLPTGVFAGNAPAAFGKTGQAVIFAAGVFAIFAVYFGYFIVFELWWSGRTPGKRALGIRVVRDAGFPIDVGAATVRNIVRILEFGLCFYALSAVSALLSKQNKRLGDFAAGTIVVRDRRADVTDIDAYLARARTGDDGLNATDRELVDRYVARRDDLDVPARVAVAASIAARIRPQLRASFEHLDDDALLEHLGRRGGAPDAH